MPDQRSPRTILAAAVVAQAAVSFVNFGLPSIGPDLRSHYGLSLPELGAVLTAALLGSGVMLIGAGIAVDRIGARRATFAGAMLGAAGLAAAAAASSKWVLFAALVVSGLGTSVIPIAGAGVLFRTYPVSRRGWALGVRQMAVPLGGTIAAVTMPLLVRTSGVELAFAVAAGAVAISGTVFALIPEERGGPVRPRVPRAFRSILRAPGMVRLFVVAALYIVVLQAILSYTVPSAREAGLSTFWASFTYFAVNVTAMVARLVWGKVADRGEGSRRVRTLVETGVVGAIGGLVFALALHVGPGLVIPAAVLFGFGALGWNALLYVVAGERTDPELAGRSVATAATVVFLVSAACTPLLGALADNAGWDVFWITTAILSALGALAATGLRSPSATIGGEAVALPRRSSGRPKRAAKGKGAQGETGCFPHDEIAYCMVAGVARIVHDRAPLVRNASAAATELIREAILDGRLPPGQRLKEEELARELGISRTPVREALLILQAEGLVDAAPNRGAAVRSHDGDDLEDLYQLRALLEGYAARRAAANISEASVADLWASCDRFDSLIEGDVQELVKENLLFHNVILDAARSRRVAELIRKVIELPLVYRSYIWYSVDQRRISAHYHRQITKALEARDGERAELVMKEHVFEARDVLVGHVRELEVRQ